MRIAFAVVSMLALPAAAWAGHVESTVLRDGTPGTYWRKNKDAVLARVKEWKSATLEDLVENRQARSMYPYALSTALAQATDEQKKEIFGGSSTWSSDCATVQRRVQQIYSSKLWNSDLKSKEWLEKANEFLANDSTRLKRLNKFLEQARDSVATGLVRYDATSPEKVITDLVMVMEFLRPENKNFFLNGYSTDAIGSGASYGGLYPGVKWDSKSVAAMRKEAYDILAEIGPAAVPTMERALRELKDQSKTALPEGSLAVSTGWSTKATRFTVPVHQEFKSEIGTLIKIAGGAPPSIATLDQANEAFRKHQEALRKKAGVKEVVVDQDEKTAFILVVTTKGSKVKLEAELDGVPVRVFQE